MHYSTKIGILLLLQSVYHTNAVRLSSMAKSTTTCSTTCPGTSTSPSPLGSNHVGSVGSAMAQSATANVNSTTLSQAFEDQTATAYDDEHLCMRESSCGSTCGFGCHKRTVLLSGDVYYKDCREIAESGDATQDTEGFSQTTSTVTSIFDSINPLGGEFCIMATNGNCDCEEEEEIDESVIIVPEAVLPEVQPPAVQPQQLPPASAQVPVAAPPVAAPPSSEEPTGPQPNP